MRCMVLVVLATVGFNVDKANCLIQVHYGLGGLWFLPGPGSPGNSGF